MRKSVIIIAWFIYSTRTHVIMLTLCYSLFSGELGLAGSSGSVQSHGCSQGSLSDCRPRLSSATLRRPRGDSCSSWLQNGILLAKAEQSASGSSTEIRQFLSILLSSTITLTSSFWAHAQTQTTNKQIITDLKFRSQPAVLPCEASMSPACASLTGYTYD